MNIRKASMTEANTAVKIMTDTALWLKKKGSQQWSDILEGTDKHDLKGAVQRGEVYFFSVDGLIVGMAAIWNKPTSWDQTLWQVNEHPQNIFYIHRLIVHPKYRGLNYGGKMLEKIKEYFEPMADELRLDCISSNEKLLHFYQSNGFINERTVVINEKEEFKLFSQLLKK